MKYFTTSGLLCSHKDICRNQWNKERCKMFIKIEIQIDFLLLRSKNPYINR